MERIINSFDFNVLMLFLMIGGLINSIIAIPTTWLIGGFGIAGNVLGMIVFGYRTYIAYKQ